MMHHIKRIAKKKSTIGIMSVLAVTGTIVGTQFNQPVEPTRYVLAAATRGTLVVSVVGSGQVSGENQIDLKPSVSGSITKIHVLQGEEVKAGTPLFDIDRKTALKAIRDASQSVSDARLSLASAELSYKKLTQPTDALQLLQSQNTVNQARRDLVDLRAGSDPLDIKQAQDELDAQLENIKLSKDGKTVNVVRDAYDDAVPVLKSIAQATQQSLLNADTILGLDNTSPNDAYERLLSALDSGKRINAESAYARAKPLVTAFKQKTDAFNIFNEDVANIDAALQEAQEILIVMDPLLENVYDALVNTPASISFSQNSIDSLKSGIQSDRSSVASKLSSLGSQTQAINQAEASLATYQRSIDKARAALEKLQRGTDAKTLANAEERVAAAEAALDDLRKGTSAIDLAVSQNGLAQRRSSLASAQYRLADTQETLNDYTVRAPFDGIVARISAKMWDQASPSTALTTLLTRAKIAQITVNEVDAAKVKNGQKATLTFDAVPELTIAGVVSEVDPIGTVSQGVVNYTVKIGFVTQDDRIKSSMSVSASVATDVHTDALLVPNASVTKQGSEGIVRSIKVADKDIAASEQAGIASETTPEVRVVQVGISNDQMTEITGGLNEGERVITRTIDPATAAKTAATSQSSLIRLPGATGGGGGAGGAGGGARFIGR